MSILNLVVREDRVLIAVDTVTTDLFDSARGEASKVIALPQARLFVAARGSSRVFATVCGALLLDSSISLERLEEYGAELLADMITGLDAAHDSKGHPRYIGSNNVVIAGWSKTAGRMKAVSLLHDPDVSPDVKTRVELDWFHVGPGDCFDRDEALPLPERPEDMLPLARRQLRRMQETDPSTATGGSLIVAEMTREAIAFHDLGPIQASASNNDADGAEEREG